MQPSWRRTVFSRQLLVGCFVLLAVMELSLCYANDTFLLSEDARAEMRRMSKENRDATEALELEISDLVRQLKLTPTGARKDELAAQLKERQQRLKTVREEFRRKLQELMGNASPGTELPDTITHEPKPTNPAVSTPLDSFFEESWSNTNTTHSSKNKTK
ncbi:uncharacterized protein LOC115310293 [Ixodes scapularis]|uniref:uncharacterized protein LOC115310293 n=1 Tax=Ixodes scapularis TaxID=6945 RepID=UPI001A9D5483|nr:uncharacterized protein LOC115310293 [Ixodes scapularis]